MLCWGVLGNLSEIDLSRGLPCGGVVVVVHVVCGVWCVVLTMISGAAYDGDPQNVLSFWPGRNAVEKPKSTILQIRRESSKQFSSLMSRWTTLFAWHLRTETANRNLQPNIPGSRACVAC